MRIATYNLEPGIVNTALMQVWQWAKENGHEVEHYNHLTHDVYDKIFAFSLFTFTPKHYVTKDMICGGTGFDVKSRLPKEIEACNYDWSAFPDCDYSIVWFSRGCIRSCPFCIVHDKEGMIQPVVPKNLNPNGKHIKVMDNNFFANPKWRESIHQLRAWDKPVDLQGVDIRIMTDEMMMSLWPDLKLFKQIKFAWDNPKEDITAKIESLTSYVPSNKLMCYVLIGYNSTKQEDLYRVETLRSYGIDPYVMRYSPKDPYQIGFSRWVNHKALFKTVSWNEYKRKIVQRTEKPLIAY